MYNRYVEVSALAWTVYAFFLFPSVGLHAMANMFYN